MSDTESPGTPDSGGSGQDRRDAPAPWERPWATTAEPTRPTPRPRPAEAAANRPAANSPAAQEGAALSVAELLNRVGATAAPSGRRRRRRAEGDDHRDDGTADDRSFGVPALP
ncbi:MAG: hypothetical protein ACXVGB_12530, partial [Mycobacteriaceae bacterium]